MKTPKTIFIFGGTFGPPHMGHANVVRQLLAYIHDMKDNGSIEVVPSWKHSLKEPSIPYYHRLQMCIEAFGVPSKAWPSLINVSEIEGINDVGTTQRLLSRYIGDWEAKYGGGWRNHIRPVFCMSSDCLMHFNKWHNAEEVSQMVEFHIFPRNANDPCNSTYIRSLLVGPERLTHPDLQRMLNDKVYQYILYHDLYTE